MTTQSAIKERRRQQRCSSPYNDSGIKNPAEDATWVSDRRFSSGADQDTVADWVSLRELENG